MSEKLALFLIASLLLLTTAVSTVRATPRVIVLRFDDALQSQYDLAFPKMQALGFVGTLGVPTGLVGTGKHMTWTEIQALHHYGWEVGSHGQNYGDNSSLDLTSTDSVILLIEINGSRNDLLAQDLSPVNVFVYPNSVGYDNYTVRDTIVQSGYLYATSGGDLAYSLISGDRLSINSVSVDDNDGSTSFQWFQQQAQLADGSHIVVFLFHNIGENNTDYVVQPNVFFTDMDWLAQNGYTVETLSQAMGST